jgi:hypothetical protein
MELVLVAPGAELLPLHPLRMLPAILVLEVVPLFAVGAFQDDLVSRHLSSLRY